MAEPLSERVLLWAASGPSIGMGHVVRTCAVAHAVAARGGAPLVLVEDATSLADVRARGLAGELAPEWELVAARGATDDGSEVAIDGSAATVDERALAEPTRSKRGGSPSGARESRAASFDLERLLGSPRSAWLDGVRDWSPIVEALAAARTRVLLVENRTRAREQADLVIHPALHFVPDAWERAHPERVRGGPAWIPLAPEVLAVSPRSERPIDLLVTFGGSDPYMSTEAVLAALARIRFEGRVLATLGGHMSPREPELRRLAAELPQAEIRPSSRDFPRWIAESKLAVTALGTTLYELAHLGVRALVLANFESDRAALAFYREHGPHLPLGIAGELGPANLDRALEAGLARSSAPVAARYSLGCGAEALARELLA